MKRSAARCLAALALTGVLAVTFLAYLQPDFLLDMGNRLLLCF